MLQTVGKKNAIKVAADGSSLQEKGEEGGLTKGIVTKGKELLSTSGGNTIPISKKKRFKEEKIILKEPIRREQKFSAGKKAATIAKRGSKR